jgi:hypothetical protein
LQRAPRLTGHGQPAAPKLPWPLRIFRLSNSAI